MTSKATVPSGTTMPSGPVLIVGFVQASLPSLAEFQPDSSVIFVEEPDVVRKRDVAAKVADVPVVRELIEWEYQLPGAADAFFNRHWDLRPAAVVPLVEYATPFAARLAERYRLPGAGLGAAEVLRDKRQLRLVTGAAGIANPRSRPVTSVEEVGAFMIEHPGSVVLKPANRQASVGTMIVHSLDEVPDAWAWCLVQDEGVFVPDRDMPLRMLVEQYVSGHEYSVEMLVRDGEPLFANVTDKILAPGQHPIELGHVVPAAIGDDLRDLLYAQTLGVLDAVGFRSGIVHCEWIVSTGPPRETPHGTPHQAPLGTPLGTPYLVECAGRFAGDGIVELIERAYPVCLVRSYYEILKGEPLTTPLPARATGGAAVRFLRTGPGRVESVEGTTEARALPGVIACDVSLRPGDRSHGLRSSWDRAGLAIAAAATPAEALATANRAIDQITIKVR